MDLIQISVIEGEANADWLEIVAIMTTESC